MSNAVKTKPGLPRIGTLVSLRENGNAVTKSRLGSHVCVDSLNNLLMGIAMGEQSECGIERRQRAEYPDFTLSA